MHHVYFVRIWILILYKHHVLCSVFMKIVCVLPVPVKKKINTYCKVWNNNMYIVQFLAYLRHSKSNIFTCWDPLESTDNNFRYESLYLTNCWLNHTWERKKNTISVTVKLHIKIHFFLHFLWKIYDTPFLTFFCERFINGWQYLYVSKHKILFYMAFINSYASFSVVV